MLANSFMKPEVLGISDAEFSALVKVLGMFERSELKHEPNPYSGFQGHCFNMGFPHTVGDNDCGTVACIGGWVAITMRLSPVNYVYRYQDHGALSSLFFPRYEGGALRPLTTITTDHAAIALRNYLTTGEPRWDEALS